MKEFLIIATVDLLGWVRSEMKNKSCLVFWKWWVQCCEEKIAKLETGFFHIISYGIESYFYPHHKYTYKPRILKGNTFS